MISGNRSMWKVVSYLPAISAIRAKSGGCRGGVEERIAASSSKYCSKPTGEMISSTLAGSGPGFQKVWGTPRTLRT